MTSLNVENAFKSTIRRIIVNNPKGNVYTGDVMRELTEAVAHAKAEPAVKLITIEGAGSHFSFGASVEEHTGDKVAAMLPVLRKLVWEIASSDVPVAALVQGVCLGGAFEVALACHLTFATPDARMGVPEIRLGVVPPVAAALLPRKFGQSVADHLVITGEELTGERLRELGMVHSCFPADSLWQGVSGWFEGTLAKFSASSLRHATRQARAAFLRRLDRRLEEHEQDYLEKLMASHDANEGIQAFIEKRKPDWKHA
ncbi:MAG: enoyl-CoA hydratase/isomerase family protein [Planctomycetes bacterium]|nr:enoyl-CoA hydratase/isomerase family protein [Planctomycetota bacterium]